MPRGCACPEYDRRRCFLSRYPNAEGDDDPGDGWCECSCHDAWEEEERERWEEQQREQYEESKR